MAALPDLPGQQQDSLQKHAYAMLSAMERGQSAPWLDKDGNMDAALVSLVARGVQTLSQSDQDLFFHRMGEALDQSGTVRDRRVANILFHSTELLNAAGHAIAHPKTNAERDPRLADVPGDALADVRSVLALSLVQHARDIPDDAHGLAQDALILYARDGGKGWGLSNSDLVDGVMQAQAYYFTETKLPSSGRDAQFDVIRSPELDMSTFQDFVVEPRYRTRFNLSNDSAPNDDPGTNPDLPDNDTKDSVPSIPTDPDATPSDKKDHPDVTGEPASSANNDADHKAADNDQGTGQDAHGGEEPPPYPDEWIEVSSETDVSVFQDQVLSADQGEQDNGEQNKGEHDRGDWPGRFDGAQRNRKNRQRQMRSKPHAPASGEPDSTPPPFPSSFPQQPPLFPQNTGYGMQQNGMQGNNGGSFSVRGPGIFGGLANLAAGFRREPKPSAPTTKPLHEQMREIHARSAEQRDERRQQANAEKKYQAADRFVSRLNERIDLFKAQEPVQEMFRRVHEDLETRAQFVRDGASDAKTQEQRHNEWATHAWERLFAKHPKLQGALTKLESDAEQIPELVNPAIAAMKQVDRDTSAEREALLAKVDRAKENSQGVPSSVPGKKNLGEILDGVIAAIKRFLSRLFGGAEVQQPAAAPGGSSVASAPSGEAVQTVRRRAGP